MMRILWPVFLNTNEGKWEPAEKFRITQVLSHPEFGFTKSRLRGDALWEKNWLE